MKFYIAIQPEASCVVPLKFVISHITLGLCVCLHCMHTGGGLVAVGSEDCTICLLALQPSRILHSQVIAIQDYITLIMNMSVCALHSLTHAADTGYCSLRVMKVLQGHISSVKALSSSRSCVSDSCKLLFSGGARASLKVWQILGKKYLQLHHMALLCCSCM